MQLNKKAQTGVIDFFKILVIGGILALVGVLIFSKVDSSIDTLILPDTDVNVNESVTISATTVLGTNSTLLSLDGYIANSEVVRNSSNGYTLVRNVDYRMTTIGTSGDLTARGNFTLLNLSVGEQSGSNTTGFNNTALKITYNTNEQSAAQASSDVIGNTVLDSFELGVIAYIVLAAVIILGALFLIGRS